MKASLCIAVAAAITALRARGSTAPAQGNSGDVSLFGSNSSNKSGKISSKAAKNSKSTVSKSAKGDPEAKAAKSAGAGCHLSIHTCNATGFLALSQSPNYQWNALRWNGVE